MVRPAGLWTCTLLDETGLKKNKINTLFTILRADKALGARF